MVCFKISKLLIRGLNVMRNRDLIIDFSFLVLYQKYQFILIVELLIIG